MSDQFGRVRGLVEHQLHKFFLPGQDEPAENAHWLHVDCQRDRGLEGKGRIFIYLLINVFIYLFVLSVHIQLLTLHL
jgi:hypothetical protein